MARLFKGLSLFLIVGFLFSMSATPASAEGVNCADPDATGVPQGECSALVALYNSTGGPGWTNNTGWLSTQKVDDWYGVVVNGGHVTSIDLHNNHLVGLIPASIGELKSVQTFDLNNNAVTGSIPPEIGGMTALVTLDLSSNQLGGSIPSSLTSLTALHNLYLDLNALTGTIPGGLFTPVIERIVLHSNKLTGTIPAEFANATHLNIVELDANYLTGGLPANIGNLTNLVTFWIGGNDLYGPIPTSITDVPLASLLFAGNGFYATNPTVTSFMESLNPNWQNFQSSQGVYPLQDQKVGWGDLTNASDFTGQVKFSKHFYSGVEASSYKIGIYKGDDWIYLEDVSSSVCPTTGINVASICTFNLDLTHFRFPLTPGVYQWRVATLNGETWIYSDRNKTFTIVEPPVVLYPTNQTTKQNPTFKWATLAGATAYNLVVLNSSGSEKFNTIVPLSSCILNTCSFSTTVINLANGDYTWKVRADMGSGDYTDWGDASFSKVAGPTPKFPAISSTTPNPKFVWTPAAGQTRYQIELRTAAGVLKLTKTLDTTVCTATLCSYTPSPALTLANGAYKWKVGAGDAVEWGTYSAVKTFNKVAPPAPVSPANTITVTNPKFTWKKIPGATKYYIVLQRSSGTLVRNMEVTTLTCDAANCWYTPNPVLNLAKGDYKWKVRAFNGYYGWYSGYKTFTRK